VQYLSVEDKAGRRRKRKKWIVADGKSLQKRWLQHGLYWKKKVLLRN
jgi:hypothetical protein